MIYEIKEEVVHDFEQDFQQSGEGDCEEEEKEMLENMQIIISDSENSQLTKEISEEEIEHAAWSMEPDKALGSDGFSINFYKQFWELIKGDLSKMMNYIWKKKKIRGATTQPFFPSSQNILIPAIFPALYLSPFVTLPTKKISKS